MGYADKIEEIEEERRVQIRDAISWSNAVRRAMRLSKGEVARAQDQRVEWNVGGYRIKAEHYFWGEWRDALVVEPNGQVYGMSAQDWTLGGSGTTETLVPPPDLQPEILKAIKAGGG